MSFDREELLALVDKIRGGTRDGWGYSRDECAEFIRLSAPAGNAGVRRIEGATDIVDEAACLIWAELCPGLVMGDTDRQHYENAAKAVLALPLPQEAEPVAWRWRLSSANEWRYGDYQPRAVIQEIEIQPLYASPSPIPEAPVGLRNQIEDLLCEGNCKNPTMCNGTETTWCGRKADEIIRALKPQYGGESGR